MDDKEVDVRKLARDRLTWEHIAYAFALSGPYGEVRDGRVSQLSEQSVLTILRSLLTSRMVLVQPGDIGEYADSIQACSEILLSVLGDDASANAGWEELGSNKTSFVMHGVEVTATASARKAKNLFFGIGEALAMLLASRTRLQLQQGAGEFYAKPAHADSRVLLTEHRRVLDFERWIKGGSDETRSVSRFGANVEFEILGFLKGFAKWSFWLEWYSHLLKGVPQNWELQRRVALIDDAIWDAGPEAVAREIERIKAALLSEKLPLAETIELNPGAGRFHAVPVPVENASYMSALLSQIADALEDCMGGHNGLSETSGDVRKLNRVLTKYRDDPQNAELTLTRVAGSLRAQLYQSRELPDNEDNLALINAVEEGVRGIRANHPEVAANREQLAQQAFQALEPEEKQKLEEALPLLAEISDPDLAEDFEQDIPELINDALRPLPDGAPPLPGAGAATRVFSRVSKMALVWERGEALHDSKEGKTARMILFGVNVGEMLYALIQIGLRLLGVL